MVGIRFKILNPNCFHPITEESTETVWYWTGCEHGENLFPFEKKVLNIVRV